MVNFSRPPDSLVSLADQAVTHLWNVWLGGMKCEILSSIVCAAAGAENAAHKAIMENAAIDAARQRDMFPPPATYAKSGNLAAIVRRYYHPSYGIKSGPAQLPAALRRRHV